MKFHVYNSRFDGRLYIIAGQANSVPRVCLSPVAIDTFIEALQKHISSKGDGLGFRIDGWTGKVEVLDKRLEEW